ncbi:T9SS type A sorting domain-containing protein [Hymenobacter terricola]|uniref:T9SS type A sorting domain-containing protein n=1 Tax=Hymenobacter terricola TaxID=2819236 RepID=UPI001B310010|nr:T9SS type A sorting domain-containing protein [Hymenobacter terricola]
MKTTIHLLRLLVAGAGLLGAAPAPAQTFPNSNLETWVTRNGREVPSNWLTTDDFIGGIFPTGTVTKTTVAHGGSFAAQLQTQAVAGVAQFPGILILGTTLNRSFTGLGGVPFTGRPRSLQFYYELSGTQALADSAAMYVLLTRRVNGAATLVAGASYVFSVPAASYAPVTLPLQYTSGLAPDSVSMVFISGNSRTVTTGTTLRIDDISFTGTATATRDAALSAALTAFPNPSPDGRYQLSSAEPDLLAAPLAVLDATGRVVLREAAPPRAAAPTRSLDLSALPAGLYTIQIFTPSGTVTQKLAR